MTTETTPSGSFDAVQAMMGILDADEAQPNEDQANVDDEVVAAEEADDEAEESGVEDEEVEEEQPAAKVYRVKVDGEEIEVPEDELLKGYSRTQDYTKKTQQLAEQRKAAEAEFEAVRGERAQYAQLLNQLSAKLSEAPTVDESLQYTDPIAYAQQLAAVMQHQRQQEAVNSERQRLAAMQQQEQQLQMQRHIAEQSELLMSLVPDWLDKETAKAEQGKIRDVAKQYGYTDEELSQVYDARAVALMRDAMRYRELVAKRQEVKPKASPVVSSKPKAASSSVTKAKQRLAKTGSVNDAAEIFKKLF